MRKSLTIITLLLLTSFYQAQDAGGVALLKKIHSRYYHGPCKYYTFSQKNTLYRNDSVVGNSVWHEAIGFPDKFRIHFGEKTDGNYVVFQNDSSYSYRKGKFTRSRTDSNSLLLILGGMFYREFENVLARFKASGYDLTKLSEQTWNGKPVYVLGAIGNDENTNQVWIDKSDLRILRIIERLAPGEIMDMRFEAHQPWCKGYVETKVSFRRNGKLEQAEEYYDIREAKSFWD